MADIKKYLQDILSKRYGRDVRQSIHDGIKAVNESAEGSADTAEKAAQLAAAEAIKAEQAKQAAQDADTSAHYYSDLAMSYTNGLSGIREGEETDNAKFYYEGTKSTGQEVNGVKAEITQLAESVETNVETVIEAKDAAQSAAESAGQSEAKAKQSEDSAAQSAALAGESKTAAALSAQNAKSSEEAAADSATDADNSALMAKSYSDGKTGIREGEDTDCARFYKEKAEEAAEKAEQVTNISIATPETPGLVKPDGTTITVDEDGTLRGADTVQVDGTTIMKAENVIRLADALKTLIDNSVQQVTGKGLSANDFTDVLLKKLNGIQEGAQVNPTPVNHLLATVPGLPLDSVQGGVLAQRIKDLDDQYDEIVGKLQEEDSDLQNQINTINGDLMNLIKIMQLNTSVELGTELDSINKCYSAHIYLENISNYPIGRKIQAVFAEVSEIKDYQNCVGYSAQVYANNKEIFIGGPLPSITCILRITILYTEI